MKQIKTILIAILLTLTANADWKPLKSLDHYGPKAFTLKKGVTYVEVRKYSQMDYGRENEVFKDKTLLLRMYQNTPPSSKIKGIPAKKSLAFKKGSRGGLTFVKSWFYIGFMLDSANKAWRLESVQDLVDMVRPIDTAAEIRLILWLNGNADGNVDKYSAKYRKSGSGYIVKEHYVSNGDDVYGCGDFTYEYRINRSGKITQKKLLRKKAVECGGD